LVLSICAAPYPILNISVQSRQARQAAMKVPPLGHCVGQRPRIRSTIASHTENVHGKLHRIVDIRKRSVLHCQPKSSRRFPTSHWPCGQFECRANTHISRVFQRLAAPPTSSSRSSPHSSISQSWLRPRELRPRHKLCTHPSCAGANTESHNV